MFDRRFGDTAVDDYVSTSNPVIVGGAARSGTTLLSVILNSHPELVCGPESDIFRLLPEFERLSVGLPTWVWHVLHGWTEPFRTLSESFGISLWRIRRLWKGSQTPAEFIDRFFGEYARRQGVSRWADKTPANVKCIGFILKHFPHAKFVHVVRDGRDTCCSVLAWSRRHHKGNPLDIRSAATTWSTWVRLGREWADHPNYVEVRYEELVGACETTLRRLFEFLELEWRQGVLAYHDKSQSNRPDLSLAHLAGVSKPVYSTSIGRWRTDLGSQDRRILEQIAGPTLRELGYSDSENGKWKMENGKWGNGGKKTSSPGAREL
ncbi:MAG: sulfotransferase [Phycisphaerae bacterium]|nr:sulfotransferase [Phycisphaerae bacterium]